jgi:hypothetical protein
MRLSKVVLALGVAALVCAPALAQQPQGRGRGMGGFGAPGLGMLVQNKSVQDELKLEKDVVTKAQESLTKVREDLKDDYAKLGGGGRRGGGGGGGGANVSPEERAAARKKTTAAENKALADVLKPDQMKRLHQIQHQIEGVRIFQDEEVLATLKLNDDQKAKIKTINDDLQKERQELFQGGGGGGRRGGANPEAMAKLQALNKDAMTSAVKVLDDTQKKTLKDLTGEPFEYKPEPPGGRGNKPRTDF